MSPSLASSLAALTVVLQGNPVTLRDKTICPPTCLRLNAALSIRWASLWALALLDCSSLSIHRAGSLTHSILNGWRLRLSRMSRPSSMTSIFVLPLLGAAYQVVPLLAAALVRLISMWVEDNFLVYSKLKTAKHYARCSAHTLADRQHVIVDVVGRAKNHERIVDD